MSGYQAAALENVALLTEGVDRNAFWLQKTLPSGCVAFLTEGVDRNMTKRMGIRDGAVALLTEGVDRNTNVHRNIKRNKRRPPHGGRG